MISPQMGAAYGEQLARIYADAELRILARIARGIAAGVDSDDFEVLMLAQLQDVRADVIAMLNLVNPEAAAQIMAALSEAYGIGGASVFEDVGESITPIEALPASERAAVAALALDLTTKVDSAMPGILRAVDDVYRQVVGEVVGSTLAGGEYRKAAAQRALTDLLSKGLGGVPTARGTMNLPDYVSMAVRTATARAAIQGHTDTAAINGLDLVMIRPGPRACDICDKWARLILASSGPAGTLQLETLVAGSAAIVTVKVKATLDDARRAGWGHPNCRCGMATYLPGISRPDELQRPPWDEDAYAAQQRQRAIEKQIREWKQRRAIAITPDEVAFTDQKIRDWQAAMRDHLAANPELKRQGAREQAGRAI